jgi:serine/threonine-protein kinase
VKCFKCGASLPAETRFCGNCGTLVADPHASTLVVESVAPEDELQRVRMVLHGEFEVERELARGGMGVIYEAKDVALGRHVALKVLAFDKALTVRSAERFKREARMVAELEHPNIVPVYRVGERGGVLFIAMKLVQGRSLDAIVAEHGALEVPVVLHILRGATRALAYAHERGIVHRDVKGANLLIDRDGRVLMSDFGVALRASDVTLTMDGALIGTPAYMSPEQCTGKRAGSQSDQYSLGIVAFEILTGVVPFASDTIAGFIKHHLYSPVPDIRLARDDVPPALLTIVEHSLHKQPEQRFATTRHMLDAIEAIPFGESDRRTSETALAEMVRGGSTSPRVATRSLPAIPEATVIIGRSAPWSRRAKWLTAAGVTALLAGGGLLARNALGRGNGELAPASTAPEAPPPPPAAPAPDSAKRQAVPPAPPPPGSLRLLANPAGAEILIDGRAVAVGSAVDLELAAGRRRISVRATGYRSFDTTVTVAPRELVNLRRVVLAPAGENP